MAADDPGMFSSQNEQDTRHFARAGKIPCIEPSDSAEALQFVKEAFALSEAFDTPVILRTTTRISHCKSVVEEGATGSACGPRPCQGLRQVRDAAEQRARSATSSSRNG